METYLNLIPLLEGKRNLELYSPVFGKVRFMITNQSYIYVTDGEGFIKSFFRDGKFDKKGECVLFPSYSVRDWDVFQWKKGDVLYNMKKRYFAVFDCWDDSELASLRAQYIYNGSRVRKCYFHPFLMLTSDFERVTQKERIDKIHEAINKYEGK